MPALRCAAACRRWWCRGVPLRWSSGSGPLGVPEELADRRRDGHRGTGDTVDVDVDPVAERRDLVRLGVEQPERVGDAAAPEPLDADTDLERAGILQLAEVA